MNAYELADELGWLSDEYKYVEESSTMLRQQADRIAELEAENAKIKTKLIGKALVKALDGFTEKSKPVAWMDEHENVIFEKNWAYPIPLYTHPHKQLTKSKFENIVDACDQSGDYDTEYDFEKMYELIIKEITE